MTTRPLRHFDWNLRSCGLHGHATYAPDEHGLRTRLHVQTPAGEAWRCLRCGTYVIGAPRHTGPAEEAPIVLRGRALRDAFVLRFLAVERGVRGLLLLALAYGVWRFDGARGALERVFDSYLPAAKPLADRLGIDLQEAGPVHLIQRAFAASHSTLLLVALGVLAYGGLELVEKVTWLRIAALALNLFAIVYILWTKRLFGLRGGHAAFAAERHGESLLEVEQAAARSDVGAEVPAR